MSLTYACFLDSCLHCREVAELSRRLQRSPHLRGGPRKGARARCGGKLRLLREGLVVDLVAPADEEQHQVVNHRINRQRHKPIGKAGAKVGVADQSAQHRDGRQCGSSLCGRQLLGAEGWE